MINERMLGLGKAPNPIRVLYAYGLQRKAEINYRQKRDQESEGRQEETYR